MRLRHAGHRAQQWRRRTAGRAQVALVVTHALATVAAAVVTTGGVLVLRMVVHSVGSVAVVVHQPQLAVHPRAGRRAQHGRSHRALNGEQHSKQQQEPEAKDFHDAQRSRRMYWGQKRSLKLVPMARSSRKAPTDPLAGRHSGRRDQSARHSPRQCAASAVNQWSRSGSNARPYFVLTTKPARTNISRSSFHLTRWMIVLAARPAARLSRASHQRIGTRRHAS
jgi:hypothetical protein